jgi:ribosomal protein S18 acetylase RimI-like enzyme
MEFFKIRRAEKKDACDIARVRITGWRQSYKDIVPDALLAKLSEEADRQRVEQALSDPANKTLRFVVELDGEIVGMGACGKARDQIDDKRGEVFAIYLLDDAKRQGIGQNFMREMAEQLEANGYTSLQVNVLERNTPARRFYEKLGGKMAKTGVFEYEGFKLPDVTYVWSDIKALSKNPPSFSEANDLAKPKI